MEFLNVGGGELLIIILLALVLFSPEDILKLMRSIGNYARTARQMWTNVTKNLEEEYIPEDIKEVVKETADSVKEARTTISDVKQQFKQMSTSIESEVSEATQLAETEVTDAVETVNETNVSGDNESEVNVAAQLTEDEATEAIDTTNEIVESENEESETTQILESSDDKTVDSPGNLPLLDEEKQPKETEQTASTAPDQTSLESKSKPRKVLSPAEHMIATQAIIESILHPPKKEEPAAQNIVIEKDIQPTIIYASSQDQILPDSSEIVEQNEAISITKEDMKDTQEYKRLINAELVNAKLAKVAEDTLKGDGSDG